MSVTIDLTGENMNHLLGNLKGLTLMEAEKILTRAMIEDGKLDAEDIEAVIQKKKAIVEREGLLEFMPAETGFADIADLAGVSQATVSRALRNSPLVREDTRKKIHEIARELNYFVNRNAGAS